MSETQEMAANRRAEAEMWLAAHDYNAAERCASDAVQLLQSLLDEMGQTLTDSILVTSNRHGSRDVWRELAMSLDDRGMARRSLGQLTAAMQDHERAMRILLTNGLDETGPEQDEVLAVVAHNRGNCLLCVNSRSALSEAVKSFSLSIDIRELLRYNPGMEYIASQLAGTYKGRATAYQQLVRAYGEDQYAGSAESDARKAVEMRRQLVEVDEQRQFAHVLAMTRYTYADILGMQCKFEQSVVELDNAIRTIRELIDQDQPQHASDLGLCLSAKVLYGQAKTERTGDGRFPMAEAAECMEIYGDLLENGRADVFPAFLEFISQRAVPCAVKAGAPALAGRWYQVGLDSIDAALRISSLKLTVRNSVIAYLAIPASALQLLFSNGVRQHAYQDLVNLLRRPS